MFRQTFHRDTLLASVELHLGNDGHEPALVVKHLPAFIHIEVYAGRLATLPPRVHTEAKSIQVTTRRIGSGVP